MARIRPPAKVPIVKPRLFIWVDPSWTYLGPPRDESGKFNKGFFPKMTAQYMDIPYRQGARNFYVVLPGGITARDAGGMEFDSLLYRDPAEGKEYHDHMNKWVKEHPGSNVFNYMGNVNSLFSTNTGVIPFEKGQDQAINKVRKVMDILQGTGEYVALDGGAAADPNDKSGNGFFSWVAGMIDTEIRNRAYVVLEAVPKKTNKWASAQPYIVTYSAYKTLRGDSKFNWDNSPQERILVYPELSPYHTPAEIQSMLRPFVEEGYSIAWPGSFAWTYDQPGHLNRDINQVIVPGLSL